MQSPMRNIRPSSKRLCWQKTVLPEMAFEKDLQRTLNFQQRSTGVCRVLKLCARIDRKVGSHLIRVSWKIGLGTLSPRMENTCVEFVDISKGGATIDGKIQIADCRRKRLWRRLLMLSRRIQA